MNTVSRRVLLSAQGNTLSEYVLATGILVTVGGIAVFGTNMKDVFKTFFAGSVNGSGQGVMQVARWGSAVTPPAASNLPPLTAGNEQVCFSNTNACLTIPVINNNNNRVDTAGALGGDVVTQLAVVLDQLPAILKALKVDQPVIDLVTDLANQGHSLGGELAAVQSLCPAGQVCQGEPAVDVKTKVGQIKTTGTLNLDAKYQTLLNYLTNVDPTALDAFPQAKAIIDQKVNQIKTVINGINASDQLSQVNNTISTSSNTAASSLADPVYRQNAVELVNTLPNLTTLSRTGVPMFDPATIQSIKVALAQNDTSQATVDKIKALASQAAALDLPTSKSYTGKTNNTLSANLQLLIGGTSTTVAVPQTQVVTSTVNAGTVVLGNADASLIHQDSNTICNNGGADCLQKQAGTDWVVIKGNTALGNATIVSSSNAQLNANSVSSSTTPAP